MEEANFYHALKIDNDRCIGLYALHERVPYGSDPYPGW